MSPDDSGIDDQIFKVRIIRYCREDASPVLEAPSAEATEHAVPIPERRGKIAPGRARPHDPQDAFHKHPVVASGRTLLVRPAYAQRRHPPQAASLKINRSITPKAASSRESLKSTHLVEEISRCRGGSLGRVAPSLRGRGNRRPVDSSWRSGDGQRGRWRVREPSPSVDLREQLG